MSAQQIVRNYIKWRRGLIGTKFDNKVKRYTNKCHFYWLGKNICSHTNFNQLANFCAIKVSCCLCCFHIEPRLAVTWCVQLQTALRGRRRGQCGSEHSSWQLLASSFLGTLQDLFLQLGWKSACIPLFNRRKHHQNSCFPSSIHLCMYICI